MNNSTKKIAAPIEAEKWFTITTLDQMKSEAVYENVSDYSLGGGYLGMKFRDGSASYVSLDLHSIADIDVQVNNE